MPLIQPPTNEQMAKELLEAGWSTWQQMVTVWLTPDGTLMFGTKQAWELMTNDRAHRFDS